MNYQTFEYLNTKEAAVLLRVSRQYLEAARCRREGPPFCKIGKIVRYNKATLDQWMRANEQSFSGSDDTMGAS